MSVDYGCLKVYTQAGLDELKFPLIVSVPHAGMCFPDGFFEMTKLTEKDLNGNADLFVDEFVLPLASKGIGVICLNIARAFIDVNRDQLELDPKMFADYPADKMVFENNRCRFGLGLIHRIDSKGELIYKKPLIYEETMLRVKNVYDVYHQALKNAVDACLKKFGFCLLLDCHSMPSKICGILPDMPQMDFCIGNLFSQSAPADVTLHLKQTLEDKGYAVSENVPYSGAFTTFHYCAPRNKIYTLQLEINRALYADEENLCKNKAFETVKNVVFEAVLSLAEYLKK